MDGGWQAPSSLPSQSGLARGGREREGGRRGRLGPRGRQRARLPSAARACPGAGLGLAGARAGTWVRKLKPAAWRWGGRPGGGGTGLPPGSKVGTRWIRAFSKENVQGETLGHRNTAGSLGRARGQTPGRRNASRPGASGEACPINPALPGDAGGAGGGLRAGSRRPPPVGAGRGGAGVVGGGGLGRAVLRLAACGCPGISGRSLSHSSLSSAWVR